MSSLFRANDGGERPLWRVAVLAVALVAALSTAALAPPAAAQQAAGNQTVTPPADGENNAQTLDQRTEVTRAVYLPEEETAVVVIESDTIQSVVVTDAGGVWEGGEIAQVERTIPPGESVIRIPVTQFDGSVGVTIGLESGLYGVPIRNDQDIFDGSPTWSDVRLSTLAGLAGGLLVTVGIAYQRVSSGREEVERVI
jgi:hypothetical protein